MNANQAELNTTRARVLDQIENRAAQLNLFGTTLEGNTMTTIHQVDILTGHKVTTSFLSRRAWLHMAITDANFMMAYESGKPNTDGTITGNAAGFDKTIYETHNDLITQADQVQIYEAIMANSDGNLTYTLLHSDAYATDNRLIPPGTKKPLFPRYCRLG